MTTIYEQIREAINRDKHSTHQQKRTQRTIAALVSNELEAVSAYTENSLKGTANHLISGHAYWDTGLIFGVTQCVYVISNVTYTSSPNTVTLGAADATHPRIDVIAIGSNGIPVVIAGTAAATPAKPEVSDEQVEITFVTISALATEPDGVTNTVIYDEDDDWTSAVSANVDAAATAEPYAGTKHIEFNSSATTGNYITLTNGTAVSPGDIESLQFQIKNNNPGAVASKIRLKFAWYNGTTRVSSWANLRNGWFGYNSSQVGYQQCSIPMGSFAPDGTQITRLRIQSVGVKDVYIDNIKYQKGIPNPSTSNYAVLDETNVWTAAQASPITTLTDGATITIDLSKGNVFEVVLDGNRTIDFTNAIAGQHFTLKVQQDDTTGGRTLTWDAANDWAGGTAPTLATGTDAVDILTFFVDSAGNIHGSLGIADSQ